MSNNIATEIFNTGETLEPVMKPDNKNSFLLNDDECAFVHAINFQMTSMKTLLISIISSAEEQMNQQVKVLDNLKDQFVKALAVKHSLVIPENDDKELSIDISNRLLVLTDKNKKEA
jgi:hypothetical protein